MGTRSTNSTSTETSVSAAPPRRLGTRSIRQQRRLRSTGMKSIALGLTVVGSFACAACTMAFYAGMALASASTAVSCARGRGADCAIGIGSLATAGAGRGLSSAGSRMRVAGKARQAASRWHPIRRRVTGPALRRAGSAAKRAGFVSGWGSNGLSAHNIRRRRR